MSTLGKLGFAAAAVCGVMYLTDNMPGAAATGPVSTDPIPPNYLALYKQAAGTCPNLDWALLAGVGKVETNHGRARLPGVSSGANYAGAKGPMQFLTPTFTSVRSRHSDVGSDIYDPADAIPAAAHYLCDSGVARGDITAGLWAYNHSSKYGADVRNQAAAYRRMNP
jgi:soluble lytic murein transglycosylase-like protein